MRKGSVWSQLVPGALLGVVTCLAAGCTEKPAGLSGPDPDPDRTEVSFAADIAPLLGRMCLECHGNPGSNNFSVRSYDRLFVPGIQAASRGLQPVKAGDPDSSYILWKLAGRGPAGETILGTRMPQGRPPMGQADQVLLRTWIAEGALDN